MKTRKMFGFTLIELMIVISVLAVLVALGYPAYQRYGFRARRADGKNFIMSIAQSEERNFTIANQYPTNLTNLGFPSTSSGQGFYTAVVTNGLLNTATCGITAVDNTTYTITLTPALGQVGDACGNLQVDSQGTKCPLATNTAANSNGKCW